MKMSEVKPLLDTLLWSIYGKQRLREACKTSKKNNYSNCTIMAKSVIRISQDPHKLMEFSVLQLVDICAILKVEIRLMGFYLEKVLKTRDRYKRNQEVLCEFVDSILKLSYCEDNDAHTKMRFSLTPPPPKANFFKIPSPTANEMQEQKDENDALLPFQTANDFDPPAQPHGDGDDDTVSDYNQWLHAMKLVARLPGGMPPEFRRKLWLSLADKYLKLKNIDWAKEEEKCFCEKWREDDEELGIQIVKDLHRTGSNLCTGPAGSINQAKLKRILLGYARYNPEVGYCQGFNMLGALILQVMDKEESESMKVMIYLVEGVLPTGYFYGSMRGLQADMGVFRELMQTKLPRLAKHLQKLQGPIENAYEPPLTNVFTMQWFLTMFCTCLPMSCVLRVWDLVLIEGSDVLLRTALVLWSLLEKRVLNTRTADDFYCKMGSFSSELLNGHLIDSNGLVEKVVKLGPIPDIQKLRDKHMYNISPLKNTQGLHLYFDDDEPESDEEDSRLAVATVWGLPWGRRGSQGQSSIASTAISNSKQSSENKDRLALDISLLKKQYDRLRERQKQAHIILTTACSTARQGVTTSTTAPNSTIPVNQLLQGRSAIVLNKGKRSGPPPGAIPPARKPSLPAVLQVKSQPKQLKRGETLHWQDTDTNKRRRDSLTWKEIKADRAILLRNGNEIAQSQKLRTRLGKSDSSSYSEDTDGEGSSTDTSLCDDDNPASTGDKTRSSSIENSPKRRPKAQRRHKEKTVHSVVIERNESDERLKTRPKSWAPSTDEIPFTLMTSDSPVQSGDERVQNKEEKEDSATESDRAVLFKDNNLIDKGYSKTAGDLASSKLGPLYIEIESVKFPNITSTSQLSPMPDISTFLNNTTISPLPTPKPIYVDSISSLGSGDSEELKNYNVNDDGVTNQYFERVNSIERPTKLDLFCAHSDCNTDDQSFVKDRKESSIQYESAVLENSQPSNFCLELDQPVPLGDLKKKDTFENYFSKNNENDDISHQRRMELLMDYSEKSSAAFIAEATSEFSENYRKNKHREEEYLGIRKHSHRDTKDQHIENYRDPADRGNHQRLSRPLHRKIPSTNSHKKRKDQRRLTLSKPLLKTEELLLTNKIKYSEPCVTGTRKTKDIPSTADLEERFKTLEKQFIADHLNKQKRNYLASKPIKDVKSILDEKTTKIDLENNPNSNTLSSSVNMENFNVKKMSSNDQSPRKSSINLSGGNDDANSDHNKDKRKEENPKAHNENAKIKNETVNSEQHNETKTESNKPKLTKLPSTAELEDRFNALEKKFQAQNKSPQKQNKEPPDEIKTKVSSETTKKKDVLPQKKTDEKGDTESEKKTCETKEPSNKDKPLSEPKEKTGRTPVEHSGDKKRIKEADHQKPLEHETVIKKAPPSTEELEKRFQALEKQMSSSNLNNKKMVDKLEEKLLTEANLDQSLEESTKSKDTFESKRKIINQKLIAVDFFKSKTTPQSSAKDKEKHEENKSNTSATPVKEQTFHEKCKSENEELRKKEQCSDFVHKSRDLLDTRKNKKIITGRRASEPPSTEDLEKRFEMLKSQINAKTASTKTISQQNLFHQTKTVSKDVPIKMNETGTKNKPKDDIVEKVLKDNQCAGLKAKTPPTTEDLENRFEALQKKDNKTQRKPSLPTSPLDNENNKASEVFQTAETSKTDPSRDTNCSDAQSTTGVYRSKNYDLWQNQNKKKVRRFSDLPSRADLENRLQFLERKLYKKMRPKHYTSDSEVSSRKDSRAEKEEVNNTEDLPSTSHNPTNVVNIEKRVQALEKQLSENSLKVLEAMSAKQDFATESAASSRRMSTETIDATGKELVRYTHLGEVKEHSTKKPINISINIKMMVNKDEQKEQHKRETPLTIEELERRLLFLEEYLKIPDENKATATDVDADLESDISANAETPLQNQTNEQNNETSENEQNSDSDILNKIEQQNDCETESLNYDSKNTKTDTNTEVPIDPAGSIKAELPVEDNEKEKPNEKLELVENRDIENEQSKKKKITESSEEIRDLSRKEEQEKTSSIIESPKADLEQGTCHHDTEENELNNVKTADQETTPLPENIALSVEEQVAIDVTNIAQTHAKDRTLVLLLDNEPKAVKVRRLTRANTEELENLFLTLEKQLQDRNLTKTAEGKLKHGDENPSSADRTKQKECEAISKLTKEIEEYTSGDTKKEEPPKDNVEKADYDWGPDPAKKHLKKRTVYLPSTRELEARFRSLERQIKFLEDVEKIDVEQRLNEIERKIKLQYSLSHEKDLTKYLELCEGKGLDEETETVPTCTCAKQRQSPERSKNKSPFTSPSRSKEKTPFTSPTRGQRHKSPSYSSNRSPYTSPVRSIYNENISAIPSTADLEHRYRALDLKRSKSKEKMDEKYKPRNEPTKQPIHMLEMLLDPSPTDADIPTTGELEHRIRVLEEKRKTPSPSREARSHSPRQTCIRTPERRSPPTTDELEARMRALEEDHCFDLKTQKNFKEFNQKLKDVVSPSFSSEEIRSSSSRPTTPKSVLRDSDSDIKRDQSYLRSTSPKKIRFEDEKSRPKSRSDIHHIDRMVGTYSGVIQTIEENTKTLHRILQKTLTDTNSSYLSGAIGAPGVYGVSEGLDALGNRLMRETSPLRRTGTHTGVPLRTDDNINERLTSIKNTIKSIDTLCEEKPYRKEKCQRYIDSLFTDSVHFSKTIKKSSLEELNQSLSHSEYTPSIRVSDASQRTSDRLHARSMGSAESLRSTSPLRPQQYRSNGDLRRELSPRRHID